MHFTISILSRNIALLCLMLSIGFTANSQADEPREQVFNVWNAVDITKKIGKKWEVFVAPQIRYTPESIKKYFVEAGVEYEFLKLFSFTLGYRYVQDKKKKEGYKNIQRYYADLVTSKEFGRWKPKLRLRYTYDKDFEDLDIEENFRTKLAVNYNIKKSKFKPTLAIESFHLVKSSKLNKIRMGLGIEYEISKRNEISAGYNLDYSYQKLRNTHIAILKYGYKF